MSTARILALIIGVTFGWESRLHAQVGYPGDSHVSRNADARAFGGLQDADVADSVPSLNRSRDAVTFGELRAIRSPFEGLSRLEVDLNLPGDMSAASQGIRCRIERAVTDIGEDVRIARDTVRPFDAFGLSVQLKLPARKARVLRELSGVLEVFCPARDAQSTVRITGFARKARTVVSHPSLTVIGATVSVMSMPELEAVRQRQSPLPSQDDIVAAELRERLREVMLGTLTPAAAGKHGIALLFNDPTRRIVSVGVSGRSGDLCATGPNESGAIRLDGGIRQYTIYRFSERLQDDAVLQMYVATPKSVVTVPFSFSNIPLP